VFTSVPIVSGNVSVPYTFRATAADADGDMLAYSLAEPVEVGTPIAVPNPSFEDPPLAAGAFTNDIIGWQKTGTSGGTFNPGSNYAPGVVPDGANVAWSNGATFSAQLAERLEAETRYVLEVEVGDRLNSPHVGYTVQLWAGATLLGQTNSPTPGNGQFVTARVEYVSPQNDPLHGQALEIVLKSAGAQTNFDQVRLTAFRFVDQAPLGMTIDPATGEIAWTPAPHQVGQHPVTVQVADGRGGTAAQSYLLQVAPEPGNRAPVILSEPTTQVTLVADSGEGQVVDVSEWSVIQYEVESQPDAEWVFSQGNTVATQIVNADPSILLADFDLVDDRMEGTWRVATATDDDFVGFVFGYQDDQHFYLFDWKQASQVGPGGVGSAGMSVKVVDAPTPLVGADLWPTAGNGARVRTLFHNTIAWADHTEYRFILEFHPGEFTITVKEGDSVLASIVLQDSTYSSGKFGFYNYSQGPVVYTGFRREQLPPRTYAYDVLAVDGDDDPLTYSLTAAPVGMSMNPATGEIAWPFNSQDVGQHNVSVRVEDGRGGVANQTFVIDVGQVLPGEIGGAVFSDQDHSGAREAGETGLPDWTVYLDENRNGQRDPGERFTKTDIDGNYRFFNVVPGAYRLAQEGQPAWEQTVPAGGTYEVTITSGSVMSGQDFGNHDLGQATNRAPAFTSTPPAEASTGEVYRYRVSALDPDGDPLRFDLSVHPAGMVIERLTGELVWLPTDEQIGFHDVVLRVQDGRGKFALQAFQVTVRPPNTAPLITSTPPGPAVVGLPYHYPVRAQDADGDSLAFRLDAAPSGMAIDAATGLLTWTPAAGQTGNRLVSIVAADGHGGEASQSFNLPVVTSAPNQAPTITSRPRSAIALGAAYLYAAQASDPNGDPLAFSLQTAPIGMTITSAGLVTWSPAAAQLGPHAVELRVSDGRGGVATQNFTINVLPEGANEPPEIISTPPRAAVIGRTYQYDLRAEDPEGDPVVWTLESAPSGMSLDRLQGTLRWTPTAAQLGNRDVVARATDGQGGSALQTFTIAVRAVNTPPVITSTPPTSGSAGQIYVYAVGASDADNDALTFALIAPPAGMSIGAGSGLIEWTPSNAQVGPREVTVRVDDGQGGVATQVYTVIVAAAAPNRGPSISSIPPRRGAVGSEYRYQVVAVDPDGDRLQFGPVFGPDGMTINPDTGLITWTPAPGQHGGHAVQVGVKDLRGGAAVQVYGIQVAFGNNAPRINSSPVTQVSAGQRYRYDVQASDPDGDPLGFTLVAGPQGMAIDALGRFSWAPGVADLGTHRVEVRVDDGRAGAVTQEFDLTVSADTEAPRVGIAVSGNPVDLGASVTFIVLASDNVAVTGRTLTIAGAAVALDATGRATVTMNQAGPLEVVAQASDAAGNAGSATGTLVVIDRGDVEAPDVDILAPLDDAVITAPVDVVGTANDANLLFYTLEVKPVGGDHFTEFARGASSVVNGVLGRFDPSMLANDSYILRLTAVDAGLHAAITERTISVAGDLKLGNFTLSFTDLSIPVAGIPITVTRTYDTLNARTQHDLGFGWRLEFRDVDVRTSVPRTGMEEDGFFNPFRDETRVYLTLPGGRREGFTFRPEINRVTRMLIPLGLPRESWQYDPIFVPDRGVTSRLTLGGATTLFRDEFTGEYFGLAGGRTPFNPANDIYFGAYTLTTKEGLAYIIDAPTGDLRSVTDTNGNTLTYSDNGIVSSTGVRVTFERDPLGRITSVTDPSGRRARYEYDVDGDLVAATDIDGNVTRFVYRTNPRHYMDRVIDPLGRTGLRSEYDAEGRLVRLFEGSGQPVEFSYDPDNFLNTVRDALGHPTTFEYDQQGNVVTQIDTLGGITRRTFDSNGNVLTETDPLGNVRSFTYDSAANVTSETDPLGNVTRHTYNQFGRRLTITDALGNTTVNSYDARGNLTSTRDAAGNLTTYEFDDCGCVSLISDAGGNLTRFEYDAAGRPTRQIDALGNQTDYTYDANGNNLTTSLTVTGAQGPRIVTTAKTYDGQKRVTSFTDPEGATTRIDYDAAGNPTGGRDPAGRQTEMHHDDAGLLTHIVYADGTTETFTYDAAGRQVASTDRAGRITSFVLDPLGRQLEVIYPDDTPATLDDNPRRRSEYDAAGQLTAEIDERGNRTEYEYDAAGRRILVRDALGAETHFEYDQAGRQIAITDPLDHTTRFTYDPVGRLVQTDFADGTNTRTAYDDVGNATLRTDAAGNATRFEYDALGRLTGVVDALSRRTEYDYDEAGNLVSQTDANGHVTRYEYDRAGRLIATVLPLGQRNLVSFDIAGNVTTTTDFNGATIEYEYDLADRLVAERYADGTAVTYSYTLTGQRSRSTDRQGGITQYVYDARDRLLSRTDPDGRTIEYTYDLTGNRTSLEVASGTTHFTFDALNRLQTVTHAAAGVTRYAYDPAGNLVRTELPNGVVETRAYDALYRLLALEQTGPAGVLAAYDYTLGPTGHRTAVEENTGRRVEYAYDALFQLIGESIIDPGNADRSIGYTYDAVGNRLSRTDSEEGVTTYEYDDNDRLLREVLAGQQTEYTYDANGNTLSRVTGAADQASFVYDVNRRLIRADVIDASGTSRTEYRYNADGVRVATIVAGTETRYLLDANRQHAEVIEEYSAGGAAQAAYVYGLDLIAQDRDRQSSFYLADALGSTRLLTDASGLVTDRYVYDAFGRLLDQSGDTVTSHLFTGEQRDRLTGLDYLRARFYDPATGRFFGMDPVAGDPGNPLTRHKFLYTMNNPVNLTDPTGLFSLVEVMVTVAIEQNLRGLYVRNVLKGFFESMKIAYCVIEPALGMQAVGISMLINGHPEGYELYNEGRAAASKGYHQIGEALWKAYADTVENVVKVKIKFGGRIAKLIETYQTAYNRTSDLMQGKISELEALRAKFEGYADAIHTLLTSPDNCEQATALKNLEDVLLKAIK
jgi:RHS repeat-associated protein